MKRFFFPKTKRLVSNGQIKAVLVRNQRFSDDLLTLYIAENDCNSARLGVCINKSCGKAVLRNRLRRLLKEAFRLNQQYFPPGFDYLFMISPSPKNKLNKSEDIDEIVNNRLKRLKLEPVRNSVLTLAAKAFGKIK